MPRSRRRARRCFVCCAVPCRCLRRRRRPIYIVGPPGPPGPPGPVGPCGNLVDNGSFTAWINDTVPEGWDVAENVQREQLSSLVYTLPYAARVGAVASEPATLGQTIRRAEAGFCYRFEFQMQAGLGQRAEVLFDDVPVVTLDIPPPSGPARFSYYSVYTPCLPPNTTMSIRFIKGQQGIFIVDNVAVSVAGACFSNGVG